MIKRRDVYFIIVMIGIIGILAGLSLTGKEKFIPRIEPHLKLAAETDVAVADAKCLSCHGPGAARLEGTPAMPENHPLRKKNCRQCHRLERKKS